MDRGLRCCPENGLTKTKFLDERCAFVVQPLKMGLNSYAGEVVMWCSFISKAGSRKCW